MKKIIVFIALSTMYATNAQAYDGKGDKKIQAGIIAFGYGSGITGTFDYGLSHLFSIGVGAEFYLNNNSSNDNFFLYGRGNVHLGNILNLPREMDLYPGLNLGFRGDQMGIGAHLGFRYFFTNNLGAYVEIGNHGSIGVSFNF